jgi:phage terminase large subunit-like protein
LATSCGGVSTGERGDRVLLDDPHNVIKAESDLEREKTVRFVRESMSNRLNDEQSAIIVIMQRLHDGDVSGDILARESNYCHMLVPMYFDPLRYPASEDGLSTEDPETGEPFEGNEIGWIDPRACNEDGEVLSPRELAARDGMLAWPKRFPRARVKEYEYELGQYAFAGQYQQSPVPRKGGIFKREYWQPYIVPTSGPGKGKWPEFDFIVVSVDSAFTEKEENDPSGCTTWGVWTDPADGYPKVMLIMAWRKHLPIHGEDQEPQERDESDADYAARCMPAWGLVEHIAWNCRRFGGADVLLIEAKANGLDVIREMQRLYGHEKWGVVPVNPKTDKVARALSVQQAFAHHLVFAPDRDFADMVKDEMALFPKGRFKDLTDSATQALRWMREQGLLQRRDEVVRREEERKDFGVIQAQRRGPIYRA